MSIFTSVSLKTFIWSDFSNSVTEMVTKNLFYDSHKFHVYMNSSPRERRLGNFKNVEQILLVTF